MIVVRSFRIQNSLMTTVVLNAGSRVDLHLEQLCMKPASICRRK